jgi:hypothetical protein
MERNIRNLFIAIAANLVFFLVGGLLMSEGSLADEPPACQKPTCYDQGTNYCSLHCWKNVAIPPP